jgi:hypothetical protein
MLIVLFALGLAISYSRLVLGVHSLDQLIFGWSLGIWAACTCHFVFRQRLLDYSNVLVRDTEAYFESRRSLLLKSLIQVTAACLAIYFVQVIIFSFIDKDLHKQHQNWIDNISSKCGSEKLDHGFNAMMYQYATGIF